MTAPARRPRDSSHILVLWLVMLLAAALRFFRISYQSLWADEGNSAAMAGRGLADIAARAAADIHPPGYYWLLSLWTRVFGESEIALRSLSAVWGIFLVWLVYQIACRLFDRRTALLAALFAAINPFLIYYSQEARMYAQLAGLAALLFYGLMLAISHMNRALPADGNGQSSPVPKLATAIVLAASIAGLYTHYIFPVILGVATLVYALWVFSTRQRGAVWMRVLYWGALLLIAGLFYLPWAGTAINQLAAWPRSGQAAPLSDALPQILNTLALGPVTPVSPSSPWMLVFLALFVLGLWPWGRISRWRSHWPGWAVPLLWLAAPVVLVLLGGLYKPAYLKFLLVAVAPFVMLLGWGAAGPMQALARGRWGQRSTDEASPSGTADTSTPFHPPRLLGGVLAWLWLAATVVLVSVPTGATLAAYYSDPAVARDDYRSIVAYINAVAAPNDAIVLNAPGQREVFEYYYQGPLPVYGLPEQRPLDEAATLQRLQEIAEQHPHLYTLYWATEESDPNRLIENWLDGRAYKAEDRWQGNMRFVIYATQQPTDQWPVQARDALLGDQIRLASYALSAQEITSGDVLQLQLQWQAERQPDANYTVFVQLLDERDQVLAQRDAPPADRPTGEWQAGESFVDNHGVLVPHGTAPGDYRLILGMYDPASGERLRIGEQDHIDLGTIRVNPPPTPLPVEALRMQNSKPFRFGEITLLGHDRYKRGFSFNPSEPLRANDLLHLTWYWRANVQPTAAWWFTARLVSGADTEVAAVSGPLVSELYPTLNWQAGEIVRGEHDMLIPDYVRPGRYQLQLFLHTGNPADGIDRVNLGWVTVSE